MGHILQADSQQIAKKWCVLGLTLKNFLGLAQKCLMHDDRQRFIDVLCTRNCQAFHLGQIIFAFFIAVSNFERARHDKIFQQKSKIIDFLDLEKQPRLFGLDEYLAEHSETKAFIIQIKDKTAPKDCEFRASRNAKNWLRRLFVLKMIFNSNSQKLMGKLTENLSKLAGKLPQLPHRIRQRSICEASKYIKDSHSGCSQFMFTDFHGILTTNPNTYLDVHNFTT